MDVLASPRESPRAVTPQNTNRDGVAVPTSGGSQEEQPVSFLECLEALGLHETTHVFGQLAKILSEFDDPETRDQLQRALAHLSEVATGAVATKKLRVVSPGPAALVSITTPDSDEEANDAQSYSHWVEIAVNIEAASAQATAQVEVQNFFHKERIMRWFPKFLAAFDVSNDYMKQLAKFEFVNFLREISPFIAIEDIEILNESVYRSLGVMEMKGGPHLIDVRVPVNMENLDSHGYHKVKQVLKYALGPLTIDVISDSSNPHNPSRNSGNNNNDRLLGVTWDCWKYELNFTALKFRDTLLFHSKSHVENLLKDVVVRYMDMFSSMQEVDIRDLFLESVLPIVGVFDPSKLAVGTSFILKISIAFKALGMCTVLPCTACFKIVLTSSNDCDITLLDIGGKALSVVRFFMPGSLEQMVNSCRGSVRLFEDTTNRSNMSLSSAATTTASPLTSRSASPVGGNASELVCSSPIDLSPCPTPIPTCDSNDKVRATDWQ
jgi:hypothetical protein